MCSVDDFMFGSVYYFALLLSEVAPENEYNACAVFVYDSYDGISKYLPAKIGVRVCFVSPRNRDVFSSMTCLSVCLSV